VFLLDSFLVFVLDKVATVVDNELNDDTSLREQLLAAQMRLDLGEMTQGEFEALESDILARLREIRERQQGIDSSSDSPENFKITGIEASFEGDEH
jgi:hypothetical protein